MNGSKVRVGEGRFITFVFFFIDKKGDSIENNKPLRPPCPLW